MRTIEHPDRKPIRAFLLSLALSATALAAQAANCVSGEVSTGSCTVPAGVTQITIAAWGGGGGGGSGANGAGGGGGAYCGQSFTVTPGETLNIVVGAGGAGGYYVFPPPQSDALGTDVPAQDGGASTVSSSSSGINLSVGGGKGGTDWTGNAAGGACSGATGYSGGKGGSATAVLDKGFPGGGGGGSATPSAQGGNGGNSTTVSDAGGAGGSGQGAGGDGGAVTASLGAPGQPGSVPGGAGGGGSLVFDLADFADTYGNGGAGADGRVTLEFTVPEVIVTPTVTPIPTLGEWSLMLLAGLLGLLGLRRSKSRNC